jgi:hypothetical protein
MTSIVLDYRKQLTSTKIQDIRSIKYCFVLNASLLKLMFIFYNRKINYYNIVEFIGFIVICDIYHMYSIIFVMITIVLLKTPWLEKESLDLSKK